MQSLQQLAAVYRRKMKTLLSGFLDIGRQDMSPDEYFQEVAGLDPLEPNEAPGLFQTEDVNSEAVQSHVIGLAPDIVLIYGSDILKGFWLTAPRIGALNMHYGILPNYRSGNSTQFACMHERLDLVGATIHYIDAGVDTGPIVSRRYINAPTQYTTLNQLISAVYAAGADELLKCAERIINSGERLPSQQLNLDCSYYPARLATRKAMKIADWRFREIKETWPHLESTIERRVFSRIPTISLRRIKYPNGVYTLLYHGIRDDSCHAEWESCYSKVITPLENFKSHIDWLLNEGFIPIKLTESFDLLRHGTCDKRYFVITFDDAYSNLLNVKNTLASNKITPAVFVNGAFCDGPPYFRVLAAIIRDRGKAGHLRNILKDALPGINWSVDASMLFNQLKNEYVPGVIEDVVVKCYTNECGPIDFKCHLGVDELKSLEVDGWQIGNHTWDHKTLSALDSRQVVNAIERNMTFLSENGVRCINWLAYPNGLAKHVNLAVKAWLDQHVEIHGIFAGGGINLIPNRTQWLRIPFSGESREAFVQSLDRSTAATMATLGFSAQ